MTPLPAEAEGLQAVRVLMVSVCEDRVWRVECEVLYVGCPLCVFIVLQTHLQTLAPESCCTPVKNTPHHLLDCCSISSPKGKLCR